MPRILKKIANPQQDITKINQNFDSISLDLADRSGLFSSVGSLENFSIPSGSVITINISVVDELHIPTYKINKVPIIPRLELYVDALDAGHLYTSGSYFANDVALSFAIRTEIVVSRVVQTPTTDEKASFWIKVYNEDTISHSVWLYTDCFFAPAPDEGIVVR